MAVHAETILRNGTVWCGRAEGVAQAVALWGGRVLATGSDADLAALIGPDTRVIDLRGRLATPGLIDAHLHLLPYGLGMLEVDARPSNAPTLDDLLGLIKARADALGPGKWVLARGYDQFKLDVKRHPWREELDRVAPDNPVHLVRTCGHISICNSKAFELAGITAATPAPPGGLIEVQNGQLTGMLAENGRDPIRKVLPAATDEELVAAIERAGQYLNSLGITSCMDAAVGMHSHFREIGAYFTAERSGRLPVRTSMCLLGDPGPKSIVPDCHRAGLVTGAGHDMLRVGPVKIFTDGSAGGRTAWMTQPYLGEDKTLGVSCQTDAVLDEYVMDYHRKGYQMAIHAIGDAAIEQVLSRLREGARRRARRGPAPPHRALRLSHRRSHRADEGRGRLSGAAAGVHLRLRRSLLFGARQRTPGGVLSDARLVQRGPEALGVDRCAGVRRQPVPQHLHHADAQDRQGHGGRRSAGA